MIDIATNFYMTDDKCLAIWMCNGVMVRKNYSFPVIAVPLLDNTAVVIIEPHKIGISHNAVMYNANGAMRKEIKFPLTVDDGICFNDAYYINQDLTLFYVCKHAYYGCVCNSQGEITRVFESR